MPRWLAFIVSTLVIIAAQIGHIEKVLAKEIRFIAQELATERAIWQPGVVRIVQKDDFLEPMYFILENPTGTDHEFAVQGLYAILPEELTKTLRSDIYLKPFSHAMMPIHVLVKANSTVKIHVSPEGMNGPRHAGAMYPFSCPIHRDRHIGGFIVVD